MNYRCLLLLAASVAGFAQSAPKPKLLTTETFFDMEAISGPRISPDGSLIVFSRSWTDQIKDQERSNLWLIDAGGSRPRELTHGNWRDTAPVWSPDAKRIAFLSDRDGTMQIHVMYLETREVAQLTHMQHSPSGLTWSPDGKRLAFTANVPDEDPILPVKLPKAPRGAQWAKPAVIVDRLSWARDGVGPIPKGYSHLFTVDAVLGGTPRKITDGKFNHNGPSWSADGKTLYVSGIRKPDAEYLKGDSEIYAMDVATGDIRTLTSRKGPDMNPQVSPNGDWIAYTGYDHKGYTFHLANLYLMDKNGGNRRVWAADLASAPQVVSWSNDNSGVHYLMEERGTSNLYFAPVHGKPRKITDGTHTLSGVSIADSGAAVAVRSSFHDPGVLVSFSARTPGPMKTLVDVNDDVLAGVKLGDVEELRFTAPDGLQLQGWLIKPAQFEPGKKYPMVLHIHGGPWSMYNVAFSWPFQNFAANGYAVLYLNPRGSTGYGQDFVLGIQKSYPGKDYDDLMAGVNTAVSKGFIDEQNLFVCGGSGGGVLTAWIVGHTNRFRAAVSMRPVIDWHSFVGTTDGSSWYDQFSKLPWEDPMEYALRSPLHYVANVTTPTMVMTGESDLRTPITQSEEFYRALKMLKKETLLVRMPDEFHGWRRPSHRLLQQLYLQAWFEKYRKKNGEPASRPSSE
ncbi:MAG: S9 family peptidase [Acidobacteria bacterium]|nr:S9 family peptidase [Acidobacteriota bacterium]